MPLKDILLYIDSYPEPTPAEAIDQAAHFAAAAGGTLSALAVQVDLQTPSNWLADRLINLSGQCVEQEAKSLEACRASIETFQAVSRGLKMEGEARIAKVDHYRVGEHVALHARTRDLCLVPMMSRVDGQRSIAEAVVFGSGRPVVLYRPGVADLLHNGPSTVVVAWDGSRTAARALADALPLLPKARQVRVVTVLNEKADASAGATRDVVRHLHVHGVNAVAEEIDAAGRKIGKALETYASEHGSDMLVMGAYGRSRVREFILGGATEYLLHEPKVPLFLSH